MMRYDIIRHLIEKRGYKSYLEIGVLGNETYNSLPTLDVKHSVDPNGQAVFNMTSDEFFASYCKHSYDIIFIDGLHLSEQVTKDIENSLTHLNDGAIIVVHDCLPNHEWEQLRVGLSGKPWTGDVWKAFAEIRHTHVALKMCVVDTDYGCGLIESPGELFTDSEWASRFHSRVLKPGPEWTWEFFQANRKALMNVITVEEFLGRW